VLAPRGPSRSGRRPAPGRRTSDPRPRRRRRRDAACARSSGSRSRFRWWSRPSCLVGPAVFQPTGHRLAIVENPAAYGLAYESVAFRPPDRPITLRAWWLPAPQARAALVFVHGGGDDNRSLPFGAGLALARDLVARGYALLMIDLRNYGE